MSLQLYSVPSSTRRASAEVNWRNQEETKIYYHYLHIRNVVARPIDAKDLKSPFPDDTWLSTSDRLHLRPQKKSINNKQVERIIQDAVRCYREI
jgi:hypothetical protein